MLGCLLILNGELDVHDPIGIVSGGAERASPGTHCIKRTVVISIMCEFIPSARFEQENRTRGEQNLRVRLVQRLFLVIEFSSFQK